MINEVKDDIYSFFKTSMAGLYPDEFPLEEIVPEDEEQPIEYFSEKIYWRKSRDEEPQKPYIILDDIFKGRINRSHESYVQGTKQYRRENWMITITFGVYAQGTSNDFYEHDRFAIDCIEAIESLFNSQETFDALSNNGIIVNEKQIGNIRDLNSFGQTNYSYRYEIDVPFEFDKVVEVNGYGEGQEVNTNINVGEGSQEINETININLVT